MSDFDQVGGPLAEPSDDDQADALGEPGAVTHETADEVEAAQHAEAAKAEAEEAEETDPVAAFEAELDAAKEGLRGSLDAYVQTVTRIEGARVDYERGLVEAGAGRGPCGRPAGPGLGPPKEDPPGPRTPISVAPALSSGAAARIAARSSCFAGSRSSGSEPSAWRRRKSSRASCARSSRRGWRSR